MRKFNFRLEKVRETYDVREQQSKRRLAEAAQARDRERRRLEEIQAELERSQSDRLEQVQKTFDVTDALMAHRFSQRLTQSREEQQTTVEESQTVVEERRMELTNARQRKQIMDNLHQKKLTEHQQEQARIEQLELDDRASHRQPANN